MFHTLTQGGAWEGWGGRGTGRNRASGVTGLVHPHREEHGRGGGLGEQVISEVMESQGWCIYTGWGGVVDEQVISEVLESQG